MNEIVLNDEIIKRVKEEVPDLTEKLMGKEEKLQTEEGAEQ